MKEKFIILIILCFCNIIKAQDYKKDTIKGIVFVIDTCINSNHLCQWEFGYKVTYKNDSRPICHLFKNKKLIKNLAVYDFIKFDWNNKK